MQSHGILNIRRTRKPSCRWQTRGTRKHAKNCSNSTCLHVQRCRWQYWSIFIRLDVGPSEICELKSREILWKFKLIEFKVIQGHPSWCQSKAHSYYPLIVTLDVSLTVFEILTQLENSLLYPPLPCLRPPSGGTPLDIDVIYTCLLYTSPSPRD